MWASVQHVVEGVVLKAFFFAASSISRLGCTQFPFIQNWQISKPQENDTPRSTNALSTLRFTHTSPVLICLARGNEKYVHRNVSKH
ncbi:hypothetical protein KIN20_018125 [Parelaphostrongylus tenuis]|uniref:Uncharacterized protein n=1 Tax=Parelaphostrongylus tenuis TaxID=148309 RepID=A0AAD5MMH1_PARTN|nr:hypothetical protein KIN20_018125 [Parelaphostrongylus tenuis]